MKMTFVSVENGIISIGFRKIAAVARKLFPSTEVCYITPGNSYSTFIFLFKSGDLTLDLPKKDLKNIAEYLSLSDIVCFSSMTMLAELTKKIIQRIKLINPKTYIVWGGIHPIIFPEDAIQYADAVCIGEGEIAFEHFFKAYKDGQDYLKTKNFWFRENGQIIKNSFLPLHFLAELDQFPLLLYADNEWIYKSNKGFKPLQDQDYIRFNGMAYNTVWVRGCPNRCSYCSNSKFIENDPNNAKLRYASVDVLIREVKQALQKHPFITSVTLDDDSLMALSLQILGEFAIKWKKEINLPFCVQGVIPTYVKKEKMEILIWAGMNRLRMGIQSGSDRILEFYKRPNKPGIILQAVSIIHEFSNYMILPAYDIILDNPIETRQDILDTLELLYSLPRPFTLNIFSLRVIPNTQLADDLKKLGVTHSGIQSSYFVVRPTLANVLVHMLMVFRPPRKLFNYLLKQVKPYGETHAIYFIPLCFFRILALIKRGVSHLKFMDFSVLPGKMGWMFWKLGISQFWRKKVLGLLTRNRDKVWDWRLFLSQRQVDLYNNRAFVSGELSGEENGDEMKIF